MPLISPVLLALALLLPQPARAQQTNVLLELFTSAGCSSCPPADLLLPELERIPGVLTLAFHVDYWDYLGWRDSFGSARNTARQKAYARARKSRGLFTPQMVVQGQEVLIGHKEAKIRRSVEELRQRSPDVMLDVGRVGDTLTVRLSPGDAGSKPSEVHVVRYDPERKVLIEGGENAGREITYTNVVLDWQTIGRWDGRSPVELRHERPGQGPFAVIVQSERAGPVLAAATTP